MSIIHKIFKYSFLMRIFNKLLTNKQKLNLTLCCNKIKRQRQKIKI